MLTQNSISTLQSIMINGLSNGNKVETIIRCEFCANDCTVIPETCTSYQWDFEMKNPILNDTWEA